jgi:hypothetical protein
MRERKREGGRERERERALDLRVMIRLIRVVVPLTRIINSSISSGEFPSMWKEALVTPILKKGDPTKKENYRPVSCLSVASKVLEKIVCDQVTHCS